MKEVAGESIGPGSSLLGHQESHEPKTVGLLSGKMVWRFMVVGG